MPRPVGESHRLAGSWAYDHGVAAHLSLQRPHLAQTVLTIVSAIRHAALVCAAGRGWPYLRLRELRVYAYFVREIHRWVRTRSHQPSPEGKPHPQRCGASSGMHVEWPRLRNHASLRRTTALIASAVAHTTASERVVGTVLGLAKTAQAFGQPGVFGLGRTARGS